MLVLAYVCVGQVVVGAGRWSRTMAGATRRQHSAIPVLCCRSRVAAAEQQAHAVHQAHVPCTTRRGSGWRPVTCMHDSMATLTHAPLLRSGGAAPGAGHGGAREHRAGAHGGVRQLPARVLPALRAAARHAAALLHRQRRPQAAQHAAGGPQSVGAHCCPLRKSGDGVGGLS